MTQISSTPAALPAANSAPRAGFRWDRLVPVLLVAFAISLYLNTLANPFIFDDEPAIKLNNAIQSLWPMDPSLLHGRRVVVNLSLALNHALDRHVSAWLGEESDGLNPVGYRLFNVLVHAVAGLALYGLVRRVLLFPGSLIPERFRNAATPIATSVALLWIAHPLCTQAVSYTIQRAESMMAMFYLLTLYAVVRCAGATVPWSRWGWGVSAVLTSALGMGTKEVMVTVPALALLLDYSVLSQRWNDPFRKRLLLHVGLMTTWLVLPWLGLGELKADSAQVHGAEQVTAGLGFTFFTRTQYAMSQASVVLYYLRLAFWPDQLALDYAWQLRRTFEEAWLEIAGISVLMISATALWLWRPAVGLAAIAFFIILSPTSSFVPIVDLLFEHRVYLPLAALIVLVVVLGFELLHRVMPGAAQTGRRFALASALVAVITLALGARTVVRNFDYRSEIAIWHACVQVRPGNARAHHNLGSALDKAGHKLQAMKSYENALLAAPGYADAHSNVGVIWMDELQNAEKARFHLEQAVSIKPHDAEFRYNLGRYYFQTRDLEKARTCFEKALELRPNYPKALNNLGATLASGGQLVQALDPFAKALELAPKTDEFRANFAQALLALRRVDPALEQLRAARQTAPDKSLHATRLGYALILKGDFAAAHRELTAALQLDARSPEVMLNAASLAAAQQRPELALQGYRQSLSLRPNGSHPETLRRMAWLLATTPVQAMRDPNEALKFAELASRATQDTQPIYLDTLAAAQAAAGNFSQAAQTQQRAIDLAESMGMTPAVPLFTQRKSLYEQSQPFIAAQSAFDLGSL